METFHTDSFCFPSGLSRWKGGPIMSLITRLLYEDEAATAVEYAVMLAMILLVVLGAIGAVGGQSGGMWSGIDTDLQNAGLGR
jgi:pilus assembly protein Flp/PilA